MFLNTKQTKWVQENFAVHVDGSTFGLDAVIIFYEIYNLY